jgi:hypothetical protein
VNWSATGPTGKLKLTPYEACPPKNSLLIVGGVLLKTQP